MNLQIPGAIACKTHINLVGEGTDHRWRLDHGCFRNPTSPAPSGRRGQGERCICRTSVAERGRGSRAAIGFRFRAGLQWDEHGQTGLAAP